MRQRPPDGGRSVCAEVGTLPVSRPSHRSATTNVRPAPASDARCRIGCRRPHPFLVLTPRLFDQAMRSGRPIGPAGTASKSRARPSRAPSAIARVKRTGDAGRVPGPSNRYRRILQTGGGRLEALGNAMKYKRFLCWCATCLIAWAEDLNVEFWKQALHGRRFWRNGATK